MSRGICTECFVWLDIPRCLYKPISHLFVIRNYMNCIAGSLLVPTYCECLNLFAWMQFNTIFKYTKLLSNSYACLKLWNQDAETCTVQLTALCRLIVYLVNASMFIKKKGSMAFLLRNFTEDQIPNEKFIRYFFCHCLFCLLSLKAHVSCRYCRSSFQISYLIRAAVV